MKSRFWLRLPRIVWRLLWDKRVPILPRVAVILALVYLLLPVEIIPDRAFGLFGYADDVALLVLAVAWLLIRSPADALLDAQNAGSSENRRTR